MPQACVAFLLASQLPAPSDLLVLICQDLVVTGLSRIIRLAYHEDASYVPLLRRSFALWRELEAETGQASI